MKKMQNMNQVKLKEKPQQKLKEKPMQKKSKIERKKFWLKRNMDTVIKNITAQVIWNKAEVAKHELPFSKN